MDYVFRFDDGSTIRDRLMSLRATANKEFTAKLHPGVDNVLGLRVPHLRALAKEISCCDWRQYLASPGDFYMEERMLHGLVLGCIAMTDAAEYLRLTEDFVHKINSWSVCDVFDMPKAFIRSNEELLRRWLCSWLYSPKEYEVRFGVVMLMKHYITAENSGWFFDAMASIHHDGYYARMAVAWAIATAAAKLPHMTVAWLREGHLDKWTHNKAIRKAIESYRVNDYDKDILRGLVRP